MAESWCPVYCGYVSSVIVIMNMYLVCGYFGFVWILNIHGRRVEFMDGLADSHG